MRHMLNEMETGKNVVFVLGYKYGDDHINEILFKALENPNNIFYFFLYNPNEEGEFITQIKKLAESMLPVLDDFERSIAYATENGEAGLLEGVKAVQAKLMDVLVKGGVKVIDPAGEAFDALEAQAVGTVPDEEAIDETVHDVYQKGYKMGKKVIRPAMVTITTGGPKRPKPEESGDEE